MGTFLNQYAVNLQVLLPLAVAILISLPVFGYFYNKLMNSLHATEHSSIYVAIGVAVTLAAGALISWKASLLFAVLFSLDGIFMIAGEFKRTDKKHKSIRRKRYPYVANGLLDEIKMSITSARKCLGNCIKNKNVSDADINLLEHELNNINLKVLEIQNIQLNEK
jgi:hypothetical protein